MNTCQSKSRRQAKRLTAAVESLECRRLLSTLTINGTNGNDNIVLDVSDNGATFHWTIDNFATQGSAPVAGVTQINVNGFGGNDIIQIERNRGVDTDIDAGLHDDIIVFKQIRQNLGDAWFSGNIRVFGNGGSDQMFVRDEQAPAARDYGFILSQVYAQVSPAGSVVGAIMNYGFDVEFVTLIAGTHNDTVNVPSTSAATQSFIGNAGGNDTVNVGRTSIAPGIVDAQQIFGSLTIHNDPSFTTLNIFDNLDPSARNGYIDAFDSAGTRFNVLSGISPGSIFWDSADISTVNLTTGLGADHVTVRALDTFTNVQNGGGQLDHYHVGITSPLSNIRDTVQFLHGPGGNHDLDINNGSETVARTYSLGFGQLQVSGSTGEIHWDVPSTTAVTVTGGSGNDRFDVYDNNQPTRINGGLGGDNFYFDPTLLRMDNIFDVTVSGDGGTDSLFMDDINQPALNPGFFVVYQQTANSLRKSRYQGGTYQSDFMTATYDGTLENTYWRTGQGSDTIKLQGTPIGHRSDLNNGGGNDYHILGGYAAAGVGALAGVSTYVHSDAGTTQFEVDDTASVLPRFFNVHDDATNMRLDVQLANQIIWRPHDITAVTIFGGSGNDQVNVNSTINVPNRNALTFQLGNGNDTVVVTEFTNVASAVTQGKVSMIGGAGTDSLLVNNANDTQTGNDGRAYYGIGSSDMNQAYVDLFGTFTFHRWISHDQVENLKLIAGNSPDTIFVNGIDPEITRMEVNGGGGVDDIEVEQNSLNSETVVTHSVGPDNVLVETNSLPGRLRIDAGLALNSLTITDGGRATIVTNQGTLRVNSFATSGSGTLDVSNNPFVIDYTGASPRAAIQSLINSARAGGAWTGSGITSSNAFSANPKNKTLGVMEASEFKSLYGDAALFGGQTLDSTAILVKYTYYGDVDFNGVVDFDDYSRIDAGFNGNKTGWLNGDVDDNGTVDFDDYSLIDQAFNTQGQALRPLAGPAPDVKMGKKFVSSN